MTSAERPVAVGDVGVVAEIDEGQMRKALRERAQHRQTAEPGIEDADHGACVRRRYRAVKTRKRPAEPPLRLDRALV